MKVKVTAGTLSVMVKPLNDLISAKMPSGVGYQIARLTQQLSGEVQVVLQRRVEILHKYKAEETENGGLMMKPSNPYFAKARAETSDLLAQEITLDVDIVTVPKNVVLEPSTLMILKDFVKVAGTKDSTSKK